MASVKNLPYGKTENPLANAKLANILEKFDLEMISEKKTKSLLKIYQKPKKL